MYEEVICVIDGFALNKKIVLPNGGWIETDMDHLAERLTATCYQFKNNHIHLYGNKNIINGIVEEIRTIEAKQYDNNEIIVEVN